MTMPAAWGSVYDASTWTVPSGSGFVSTLTPGATDIYGGNGAVRFRGNGGSSLLRVSGVSNLRANYNYTILIWVKLISGSTGSLIANVNDSSFGGNYSSKLILNQWVNVHIQGTTGATPNGFIDLVDNTITDYVLDFYYVEIFPEMSLSQLWYEFFSTYPISGTNANLGQSNIYRAGTGGGDTSVSIGEFHNFTSSGSVAYGSAGSYTWICPKWIDQVTVLSIGGGGGGCGGYSDNVLLGGGGGGGCVLYNNYPVTSGASYTLVAGAGGTSGAPSGYGTVSGGNGGRSGILNQFGNWASYANGGGGGYVGGGGSGGGWAGGNKGGNGGNGSPGSLGSYPNHRGGGGGGAAGWLNSTSNGGAGNGYVGAASAASGGGDGALGSGGGGGGGVNVYTVSTGQVPGGAQSAGGGGNSGGNTGASASGANGGNGGLYGGGGGAAKHFATGYGGAGGAGIVRLLYSPVGIIL